MVEMASNTFCLCRKSYFISVTQEHNLTASLLLKSPNFIWTSPHGELIANHSMHSLKQVAKVIVPAFLDAALQKVHRLVPMTTP